MSSRCMFTSLERGSPEPGAAVNQAWCGPHPWPSNSNPRLSVVTWWVIHQSVIRPTQTRWLSFTVVQLPSSVVWPLPSVVRRSGPHPSERSVALLRVVYGEAFTQLCCGLHPSLVRHLPERGVAAFYFAAVFPAAVSCRAETFCTHKLSLWLLWKAS